MNIFRRCSALFLLGNLARCYDGNCAEDARHVDNAHCTCRNCVTHKELFVAHGSVELANTYSTIYGALFLSYLTAYRLNCATCFIIIRQSHCYLESNRPVDCCSGVVRATSGSILQSGVSCSSAKLPCGMAHSQFTITTLTGTGKGTGRNLFYIP